MSNAVRDHVQSFPSPKTRLAGRELRRMKATHLRHSAPEEVDSGAICQSDAQDRAHRLGRWGLLRAL